MLKVTMRPSLVNIIHQPQEKTQLYFLQFACKKRNKKNSVKEAIRRNKKVKISVRRDRG